MDDIRIFPLFYKFVKLWRKMAKTKMDSKLLVFKLKTNMFQNSEKELKKFKTKKNRNFLIENANEIVGWFLVQELQDITCVQKCEGSQ
jgi:hypothetical protein